MLLFNLISNDFTCQNIFFFIHPIDALVQILQEFSDVTLFLLLSQSMSVRVEPGLVSILASRVLVG